MIINPYLYGQGGLAGLQTEFVNAIVAAGSSANLKICLDAGDITCATNGTTQSVLDTSGNGNHFYRGSTSSVESTDMSFNGTPGSLNPSAYWQGASGSTVTRLNLQAASNPAWVQTLHKRGALMTVVVWYQMLEDNFSINIFNTNNAASANTGIMVSLRTASGTMASIFQSGASSGNFTEIRSTIPKATVDGLWHFAAVTIDEAAGNYGFVLDGTSETVAGGQWAVVNNANATAILDIGDPKSTNLNLPFNSKLTCYAVWDRALSMTELQNIRTATRTRFGV